MSLRRRLTYWLVGTAAVLAVSSGTVFYAYVRHQLLRQLDAGLQAKARAVAALTRLEADGRLDLDFSGESMPEYLPGRRPEYFEIVGHDGRTIVRSESMEGKRVDFGDVVAAVRNGPVAWNVELPGDRDGRAAAYATVPQDEDDNRAAATTRLAGAGEEVVVVVAQERTGVDAVLATLLSGIAVGTVVVVALTAVAVRMAVGRGLQPVDALASQAEAIGPRTLSFRFESGALPAELRPIARRLNDLLDRLEQAFVREQRLNADIAHELRTPIAELRTMTEVASRGDGDVSKLKRCVREAHEVALRMGRLVDTLLELARRHGGIRTARPESLDLNSLVADVLIDHEAPMAERALACHVRLAPDVTVWADSLMLRRIIENLVSNAVAHGARGGCIEVASAAAGGQARLTIGNSNDTLVEEDIGQLFDPFWRKDAARTDDAHAGLGLALVAEYARQNDVTIAVRLDRADWVAFDLNFPSAGPVETCVA